MHETAFDILVIGAGIAGATVAAALAPSRRVALLEAEDTPGYHTTGRSAAIWIHNYGPPEVQLLTGLSRAFFERPPPGFAERPILHPRGVVFLAPEAQRGHLHDLLAQGHGLRAISIEEARRLAPALRPDYAVEAAIEEDAFDMDVATLHQGYLRQLRAAGGELAVHARSREIVRRNGEWVVASEDGRRWRAPVLVNAAGAWGDVVAGQAGVAPLGLSPRRRTGVIIDPQPHHVTDWPLINDVDHTWYVRPEARTKLMVCPADETPDTPHDVQPDELDVAIGIDKMQRALDIEVRRVEHSWAGLRTFAPDRHLAFGWEAAAEGFFWCVGQGGYGIQTSPAAGRLVADLVLGRDPGEAAGIVAAIDPMRLRGASPAT